MAIRIPLLIALLFIMGSARAQPDCIATSILEPLDTWQMVSGSYDDDGWMIYEVTMYLGVNYVFKTGCGDGATADHDTFLEWMTPVCTTILSNDDGCENGRSILSFNSIFDDAVLWIRVRGTQGQGGSFTMAYRSIGGVPGQCNDCPSEDATLAPSSLWQTMAAGYGDGGCKVYRVFTSPGMEYTFKTGCGDGATADHDTHLEVFGGGCGSLAADDDGCEMGRSTVTWTAGGGSLWVKVRAANGGGGTFTLAYRRSGGNGSICAGCPTHDISITPGNNWSTSTSSYLSGGCQIYRVSVTEGYQYTFKTGCGNGASADHGTRLELFDAQCSTLGYNEDGCENGTSIIEHVATYTGFLYLRVSGTDAGHGFYTLAHRRTGTCSTCPFYDAEITPSVDWQNASGSYFSNGCWTYKANVTEGRTYVFQTSCGNGAGSDHASSLQLFDSTCAATATAYWDCQGPGTRLYHLATATGQVYLKVYGLSGASGTHTLAFRDVGPAHDVCDAITPIGLGWESVVELSGVLQDATSDGDFDPSSPWYGSPVKWYGFDLDENCYTFIVSYCGLDPAWTNTLDFLTTECPAGETLVGSMTPGPFGTCEDGNATYSFEGLSPGIYYLPILYDTANSSDGEFVVTVRCTSIICCGFEEGPTRIWSVYPNPGSDELWLDRTAGGNAKAMVLIHDPLGRLVWQGSVSDAPARIDTGALPQGVYVVQVLEGTHISSVKWVKE